MKLKFEKGNLLSALQIVSKATPNHTTQPILECVMIEAKDGEVTLKATDMELVCITKAEGEVIEEGVICLDAKMFLQIVSKMPNGEIALKADDTQAQISSGKVKFNISVRNADVYPKITDLEDGDEVTVSQFTLKEIISKVLFSIGADSSQKTMTGGLLKIKGDRMSLTTLDGYRISIRQTDLRNSYDPVQAIIPGKSLTEVNKILSGDADKDVVIAFTEKQVAFKFDKTTVITRTIEGNFFDIARVINTQHTISLTVDRQAFMGCIDRATLLTKEGEKKPIIMQTDGDAIEMRIQSAVGSMDEKIDVVRSGDDIEIGLNPHYMVDVLKAVDDEKITLYLTTNKQPVIIRDRESYLYCVLPINFK